MDVKNKVEKLNIIELSDILYSNSIILKKASFKIVFSLNLNKNKNL
jgi:hypothetical protein